LILVEKQKVSDLLLVFVDIFATPSSGLKILHT